MTCKLGNSGPGLGQVLNISHTTANALEDQTGYMYTQHSEHIGPGLGQALNISNTTANALEDQTGYMYTQHSEHIANIRSEIIYPIGQ